MTTTGGPAQQHPSYAPAVDPDTLRAAVDASFEQDPASTATWPDPHPDHEPDAQEYSRCLDPAKYRILTCSDALTG